ncbi:nucleic acid-binding protein [Bremerella cremea]|uniref:Nucleic acid-binding protein n=1 Tax=Blastopirellula marina TaxID=124 RepID=A0A2S8G860_9BACT|nr:nucleic acid-binding protein [Blastopirellula marina]RCS52224.1 nucleic acid-binding protein [Bremerella cremea]
MQHCRDFQSERNVKRRVQVVSSNKLLEEKLGRNDLCQCGSA